MSDAQIEEPRAKPRWKWTDIVMAVLVVVGLFILVRLLGDVGFTTIWDQLRSAEPVWLVLGLLAAQLMFLTQAVVLRGASAVQIPWKPAIALQAALKVFGLTLPGSASRVATDVQFLENYDVKAPEAILTASIEEAARGISRIILLLAVLPFVDIELDGVSAPSLRTVLLVLGGIAVAAGVVAFIPRARTVVSGLAARIWTSIKILGGQQKRQIGILGGALATELVYALALGCFAQAYDIGLSPVELIAVNTAGSMLASVVPSPGGIGSAEAALTGSLVALGVPAETAFPIALTQRLGTQYLPPLWGLVCLQWLRRKSLL
ncbi:lysylphosphatidylglycerol synthase transmembrane domain-containing protein [Aeromicrobium panaciterrae]|uniref:lysylphosphatidylglycerol synthase transmembrane domain-containing protein n=1 Tax=Aeromicrobium panaciterrae TaxID=363861 RepID=UPI0031DF1CB0